MKERKPCEVFATLAEAASSPLLGTKGLGVFVVDVQDKSSLAVIAAGEGQARNAVGRMLTEKLTVQRCSPMDLVKALIPPKKTEQHE